MAEDRTLDSVPEYLNGLDEEASPDEGGRDIETTLARAAQGPAMASDSEPSSFESNQSQTSGFGGVFDFNFGRPVTPIPAPPPLRQMAPGRRRRTGIPAPTRPIDFHGIPDTQQLQTPPPPRREDPVISVPERRRGFVPGGVDSEPEALFAFSGAFGGGHDTSNFTVRSAVPSIGLGYPDHTPHNREQMTAQRDEWNLRGELLLAQARAARLARIPTTERFTDEELMEQDHGIDTSQDMRILREDEMEAEMQAEMEAEQGAQSGDHDMEAAPTPSHVSPTDVQDGSGEGAAQRAQLGHHDMGEPSGVQESFGDTEGAQDAQSGVHRAAPNPSPSSSPTDITGSSGGQEAEQEGQCSVPSHQQLQRDIDRLTREKDEALNAVKHAKEHCAEEKGELSGRIKGLEDQIKNLQDQLTEAEQKWQNGEQLRAEAEKRSGDLAKELQDCKDQSRRSVHELRRQMETMESQINTLTTQTENQDREIAGLRDENTRNSPAEVNSLRGEVEDLRQKWNDSQRDWDNERVKADALDKENRALQRQLGECRAENNRALEIHAGYDNSLTESNKTIERLQREVRRLENDKATHNAEVSSLRSRIEEQDTAASDYSQLSQQHRTLQQQVEQLRTIAADQDQVVTSYNELHQAYNNLEQEFAAQTEKLQDLEAENLGLGSEYDRDQTPSPGTRPGHVRGDQDLPGESEFGDESEVGYFPEDDGTGSCPHCGCPRDTISHVDADELNNMEVELHRATTDRTTLEGQRDALQAELQQANTNLNILTQQRDGLGEDLVTMTNERDALQQDRAHLAHARAELAQYRATIDGLTTNLEEINSSLEDATDKCDNLEDELVAMTEERDGLSEKREALAAELGNMTTERNGLREKRDELEKDLENMTKERDDLEEKRKGLEGELDTMTQERNGLQETRDGLEKDLEDMTKECNELEEKRKGLEEELNVMTEERTGLQEKRDGLEKDLEDMTKERNELEEKRTGLEEELNAMTEERTSLQEKRDGLAKDLEDMTKKLADMTGDRDRAILNLTNANTTSDGLHRGLQEGLETMKTERDEAIENLEAVTKLREDKEAELASVRGELQQANTSLGSVREELQQANASLGSLRGELQQANTSLGSAQEELQQANTNLGSLRGELQQANTSLGSAQEELQQANTNLGSLRGELQQANTSLGSAQEELQQANTNLGSLRGELQQANTSLGSAQEELQQANTNLGSLRGELQQANTSLGSAQEELQQANTNLAQERQNHAQELATLTTLRDQALGDLEALKARRDELEAMVRSTSVADKTEELEEMTRLRDGLQADLDAAKVDLETMTRLRNDLQQIVDESGTATGEPNLLLVLTRERDDAIAEGNRLREELNAAETVRRGLPADLTAMTGLRDGLQNELNTVRRSLNELRDELENRNDDTAGRSTRLERRTRERDEARDTRDRLQVELNNAIAVRDSPCPHCRLLRTDPIGTPAPADANIPVYVRKHHLNPIACWVHVYVSLFMLFVGWFRSMKNTFDRMFSGVSHRGRSGVAAADAALHRYPSFRNVFFSVLVHGILYVMAYSAWEVYDQRAAWYGVNSLAGQLIADWRRNTGSHSMWEHLIPGGQWLPKPIDYFRYLVEIRMEIDRSLPG